MTLNVIVAIYIKGLLYLTTTGRCCWPPLCQWERRPGGHMPLWLREATRGPAWYL